MFLSTDKRLLHAARTDDLELLQEIITSGAFDANHSDGVGRNALHYAAMSQSTTVLPEILNLEIDVDYQDRTNADTPLHAAVSVDIPDGEEGKEVEEVRNWIGKSSPYHQSQYGFSSTLTQYGDISLNATVNELLEAGADPTIPNKDGDLPADLLSYGTKSRSELGQELVARLKRGQAEMNINASDIANDDVADDGEGKSATRLINALSLCCRLWLTSALCIYRERRHTIRRRVEARRFMNVPKGLSLYPQTQQCISYTIDEQPSDGHIARTLNALCITFCETSHRHIWNLFCLTRFRASSSDTRS